MAIQHYNNLEQIKAYRQSGEVKRCHTHFHHGHYDVAQHCYNMLGMYLVLVKEPDIRVVKAIMSHDMPELWTGDVPFPAKKIDPEMAAMLKRLEVFIHDITRTISALSAEEHKWLKALDMLELFMWVVDQMERGNRGMNNMYNTCKEVLNKDWIPEEVQFIGVQYEKDPSRLNDYIVDDITEHYYGD